MSSYPAIRYIAKSSNKKLGPIPCTIVDNKTCPSACPLKEEGCYAKAGALGYHWRELSKELATEKTWHVFLDTIRHLPNGTLWRYAVAGDLPGDDNEIDPIMLGSLVRANTGLRGFTYTHKPVDGLVNSALIQFANDNGFTVNISGWNAKDADDKAQLNIGPVVCLVPHGTPDISHTPAGRTVIVCPAQRENSATTCAKCKLCSDPKRKIIVGFLPHGSGRPNAHGVQNGGKSLNERLEREYA